MAADVTGRHAGRSAHKRTRGRGFCRCLRGGPRSLSGPDGVPEDSPPLRGRPRGSRTSSPCNAPGATVVASALSATSRLRAPPGKAPQWGRRPIRASGELIGAGCIVLASTAVRPGRGRGPAWRAPQFGAISEPPQTSRPPAHRAARRRARLWRPSRTPPWVGDVSSFRFPLATYRHSLPCVVSVI